MFEKTCEKIRESVYGVLGTSVTQVTGQQAAVNATNGTAFMVAPGFLITAAHFAHQENNREKPVHTSFEIIRAPDIGSKMEKAIFVAEHPVHDIALLKIEAPKNYKAISLTDKVIPRGSSCGFLGFPLAKVLFVPSGLNFNLFERFQGAYISNYIKHDEGTEQEKTFYEIDNMMYPGSSGCPAFTVNGEVLGMQVAVRQEQNRDNKLENVDISLVVPSIEIIAFLKSQNIKI